MDKHPSNLKAQGSCKHCGIALAGYSDNRRYVCGSCAVGRGNFPRKIYDHINAIPDISNERKEMVRQNQIDSLKNENLFLTEKLLKLEEELYGYKVRNQKQFA